MRSPWVVLTGLAVVICSCEAPDSSLESASQPIIAGPLATGDPAIMELLAFKGNTGSRCTATLITPRLLIAAAHCIVEAPGFQFHVYPGNNDGNDLPKDTLPIKTIVYDTRYGNPRQGNDFSIIVLETPLAIKPIPLNRAALEQAQGKMVRYVGYGLSTVGNPQSGGIKRQSTAPLAMVSRLLLAIAPNAHIICRGDSGGPLLLDSGQGESLIGVASFVDNPACTRNSYYQRVDTQLAWIEEQIRKYDTGGPAPPADGGASDAEPPVTSDAAPPDMMTTPPPGGQPDAAAPPADSAPPTTTPPPDARAADARAPGTTPPSGPMNITDGGAEGCACALGARRAPDAAAGVLAALLLALTWVARRRRR